MGHRSLYVAARCPPPAAETGAGSFQGDLSLLNRDNYVWTPGRRQIHQQNRYAERVLVLSLLAQY